MSSDLTLEQAWPFLTLAADRSVTTHLSASSISQFMRCPEQFRQTRVLGLKERPGAALVVGGADHVAHEHNFRQKIDTHEDLPTPEVLDAFDTAWNEKVTAYGGAVEIEWGDRKPGEIKDEHYRCVAGYHEAVSPLVQPLTVERRIDRFIEGVPVPLIGYIDVETERSLIERKTSNKAQRQPKAEWIVQGLIYQAHVPKPVEWHVVVKTGQILTSKHGAPALALEVGESTIDELVRSTADTMVHYMNTYGPDNPWPGAITHPWACGFCSVRPRCHWWTHERTLAA